MIDTMKAHLIPMAMALIVCSLALPCVSQEDATPEPGKISVEKRCLTLLEAGEYKQLDELAAKYRTTKERSQSGSWRLSHLYEGLRVARSSKKGDTTATQMERAEQLKKWIEVRPNSITARVAWAGYLKDRAWEARGGGFAGTVTEGGWEGFRDNLEKARIVLEDAKKLPERCPEWYSIMLGVALGQSWGRKRYDALFEEAFAFEPGFHSFCNAKAIRLLRRWGGGEGEAVAFAKDIAERTKKDFGDIYYARIALEVVIYEPFEESGFDWERTKKGFQEILKSYPQSDYWVQNLARVAAIAKDQETARDAFLKMKEKPIPEVWNGQYRKDRAWALPPEPAKSKKKK
jgi:hypothetical protein